MKKILLLSLIIVALASCQQPQQGSASEPQNVVITRHEMSSEVVKTVANMSIEGMTCAAGCGGKIQQDLRAINGVTGTTLDYADNRTQNVVSVEYNPSVISELELIKCVNAISDGMYKVTAVDIVSYKGLQSSGSSGGSGASVESNFGKVFKVFNFLESVVRLIQK